MVRDLGFCMVGDLPVWTSKLLLAILARHYHCLERFLRKLKKDVIFTLGSVSFLWSIDEDDGWWMDGWMELSWRVLRRLHSARTGA